MQVFRPLFAAITSNNLHFPAMRRKDPQRPSKRLYLCIVKPDDTSVLCKRHTLTWPITRVKFRNFTRENEKDNSQQSTDNRRKSVVGSPLSVVKFKNSNH